MTLADLLVNLRMNAGQFTQGVDEALGRFQNMLGTMIAGGASLSAAVTAPLVKLGQSALAMGTQMQQAQVGFETMLGSGERASAFLQDLKDFAAKTPFEFPDLLEASKRLLAMGFAAEDVVPMMRAVGDAVAGLGGGAALIDRVTLALGQMRAKGKVSAEEMRQTGQAGIPAWEFLATKIGVSIPEAMKMAEKGAISAGQAIPAIIEGMNAKFGGMMASFAETAAGQWSNLKDSISYVLADIGASLLPLASMMLENFLIPAGEKLRDLATWFSKLPDPIKFVAVAFAGLAAAIGPVLLGITGLASSLTAIGGLLGTTGIAATLTALLPILGGVAAAIGAVAAAWALWQLEPVRNGVQAVWDVLNRFWQSTLAPVVDAFSNVGSAVASLTARIVSGGLIAAWDGLTSAGRSVWDTLNRIWNEVIKPLVDAFVALYQAVEPVIEVVAGFGLKMAELQALIGANILIIGFKGLMLALEGISNAAWGLMKLAFDAWLTGLGGIAKGVAFIWKDVFAPAITFVVEKIKEFLGWIMKIPGVSAAVDLVTGAFDKLKSGVTGAFGSIRSGATEVVGGATVDALVKAKNAVEAAQKAYDAVFQRMMEGKASSDELKAAQVRLTAAQDDLNKALTAGGISADQIKTRMAAARTEFAAAQKSFEEVNKAFRAGTESADKLTAASDRLRKAKADLEQVNKDARTAASALNVELRTLTTVTESAKKKTVSLEEAQKGLKEEVKKATLEFEKVQRAFNNGEASSESLEKAYVRLVKAQDNLDPDRVAKRYAKAAEDMEKRYDALAKWFTDNYKKLDDLNKQLAKSATDLALDFGRAYEGIASAAKKQIDIIVPLNKRLPDGIQEAIDQAKRVSEAYDRMGIDSPAALNKTVTANKAAWETIARDAGENSLAALQAWVKYEQSRQDQVIMSGGVITKAEKDALAERQTELDIALGKQKSSYDQWKDQVSRIFDGLAAGLSESLLSLFKGDVSGAWATFKDEAVKALDAIALSILDLVTNYVVGKLKTAFLDLLDNVFPKLAGWLGKLAGDAASVGGAISGGAGGAAGAIGGAGQAAGGVGGAAGGVGGAAAGATSGVWGAIGAIGSVGTMVSSIIGNFQMRGMNKSLDLIEASTRFTAIALVGSKGVIDQLWNVIDILHHVDTFLWDDLGPRTNEVKDGIYFYGQAQLEELRNIAGFDEVVTALGTLKGASDWLAAVNQNGFEMLDADIKSLQSVMERAALTGQNRNVTFNVTQLPGQDANALAAYIAGQLRMSGMIS